MKNNLVTLLISTQLVLVDFSFADESQNLIDSAMTGRTLVYYYF